MTIRTRHLLTAAGLAATMLLAGCGGGSDEGPVETNVEQMADPYADMPNMTDEDAEPAPAPVPTPTPSATPAPTPMADAVETPDADAQQQMLDDAAATGMTRRIDRTVPPPANTTAPTAPANMAQQH